MPVAAMPTALAPVAAAAPAQRSGRRAAPRMAHAGGEQRGGAKLYSSVLRRFAGAVLPALAAPLPALAETKAADVLPAELLDSVTAAGLDPDVAVGLGVIVGVPTFVLAVVSAFSAATCGARGGLGRGWGRGAGEGETRAALPSRAAGSVEGRRRSAAPRKSLLPVPLASNRVAAARLPGDSALI